MIYVIEHCGRHFRAPPPEGRKNDRLVYLRRRRRWIPLEVIAVEADEDMIYVIHAMPLRRRYLVD